MEERKSIEVAVERLLADYLFNPTDKPRWVNKLIADGLIEEDAKRAYKIAANRYHISKNEQSHKKSNLGDKLGNVAKYSVAGIFTFTVMPLIYIIFVLVAIAILGFIFGF